MSSLLRILVFILSITAFPTCHCNIKLNCKITNTEKYRKSGKIKLGYSYGEEINVISYIFAMDSFIWLVIFKLAMVWTGYFWHGIWSYGFGQF